MKSINRLGTLLGISILFFFIACRKPSEVKEYVRLPFEGADELQIDSVLQKLTLEEKIGQLIIWTPASLDSTGKSHLFQQLSKGRVGGLVFPVMELEDYVFTADTCKQLASLPLFFGTSQKVSLHNQFIGVPRFPTPSSLSAVDSPSIVPILEDHYIKQCRALGINLTFSPTIRQDDSSSDGYDYQTFGSNKERVLKNAFRLLENLQKQRILSVVDGFADLSYITNDTLRDSLQGHYHLMAKAGLGGLLVVDKVFQSDSIQNQSPRFLKKYLSKSFQYHGLVVVNLGPLESPSFKLYHGADLFVTQDAQKAFYSIVKQIERGRITEVELDKKVKQVLLAKSWINGGRLPLRYNELHGSDTMEAVTLVANSEKQVPVISPAVSELQIAKAEEIKCYFEDENWKFFLRDIYEKSVILVNNGEGVIPLSNAIGQNIRVYEYSDDSFTDFENYFSKYAPYLVEKVPPGFAGKLRPVTLGKPLAKTTAVILLDNIDLKAGYHRDFISSVSRLAEQITVVLINFGNPKNLMYFNSSTAIIQAFERNKYTEQFIAQLLFGGVAAKGRLPVAVANEFPEGSTVYTDVVRLGFSEPEYLGIESSKLSGIHAIAESAIDKRVFPGCQVVLAKNGKVIFSKSFGTHTYSKKVPVSNTDIYDVASITKAAATTLAVMKMEENNQIEINGKIGDYLILDSMSSISDISLKELLLHESGLSPQMPLSGVYNSNIVPARGCNNVYCRKKTGLFTIRVAKDVYMRSDHRDSIWAKVFRMHVLDKKRYRYSDVNFFLLQRIVEKIAKKGLDEYVQTNFYNDLGLKHSAFNPLNDFKKEDIIPTENDRSWRKNLIQGFVHDPAAALMGGVGGNAGLFSNAEDLAVLFQMLLNKGTYGGKRFLLAKTVDEFTSSIRSKNRGLGFDMTAVRRYPAYSRHASKETFGHTGFTGTCVWVDPQNQSVFVFLSNRIHPNSRNTKIFSEEVRSRIHNVFYDALDSYHPELPQLSSE